MGIFMPRVYAAAGVQSPVEQNLLQVLLWGCTVASTYFGFMKLADKYSRRMLYAVGAGLGIFAWLLLVYVEATLPVLLLFAVSWGVAAGVGAQAFYGVWAGELFATPYRASAQGVLFFAARISVGLLSYWFPTLLVTIGVAKLGLIMIGLLLVSAVVGTLWAPNTQGKTLEQIELERYGAEETAADLVAGRV